MNICQPTALSLTKYALANKFRMIFTSKISRFLYKMQNSLSVLYSRAQTESLHFDSRILIHQNGIKNKKMIREVNQKFFLISDSLGRIILFLILIHFDLRFSLILFILICDSVWFYSFWFVANHDSPANQKSNRIKN